MSQKKSKTMPMQIWGGGGVKEVYYGIVQVVNALSNALHITVALRAQ